MSPKTNKYLVQKYAVLLRLFQQHFKGGRVGGAYFHIFRPWAAYICTLYMGLQEYNNSIIRHSANKWAISQ